MLCKAHDIDMKFYTPTNHLIKNKSVSAILIKHSYPEVMDIFSGAICMTNIL